MDIQFWLINHALLSIVAAYFKRFEEHRFVWMKHVKTRKPLRRCARETENEKKLVRMDDLQERGSRQKSA